ncbi:MAG: PAS domain S-box protein [Microcoleus sp. SIO2G3]|nr:PAS domain S-box protein [Microcoleus sp. SIO2G3]
MERVAKHLFIEGSEADAVIGQRFWEVPCWSFSPTVQAQLQAAIAASAAGEFVRYEVEIPDADGCLHTFDFSLKPIKDETGQVVLLIPEGRDITEIKQAQAALIESEARLQAILDKSPVTIYLKDIQGRYLLINPECERLSGFSREQFVGKTDYQLLPTAVADKLQANDQEVLNTLTPLVWEKVMPWRHELRTYMSVKFPLFDAKGIPNAICGISTDITERKRTEEQIRFQARLLDVVEQAIVTTDLNGTITYWNRFAETLYGWHSAEVIGQNILEVTPAEVSKPLAAEILSCLQRGESWYGEFLVKRRDGTTFPVMVSDAPIFDGDGELIGIVGVTSDITQLKLAEVALSQANEELELRVQERTATLSETNRKLEAEIADRKQAEEKLRQSEERFRRAIVHAPFPIMIHAEDGEVIQINQVWTEETGYIHSDIPTTADWTAIAYEERREWVKAGIDQLYDLDTRVWEGEFIIKTRQGETKTWDFSSAPLGRLGNGKRLVISIAKDVTDRKQAEADILMALEKEQELSELRNSFLSLVSHEFRTPLTTIRSSAELLERYNDKFSRERKLNHYQRIQGAVERMTQLLDEVLLIGQAEAGKLKFEPTRLDLVSWCRDLVDEMQIVVENTHTDSSAHHTLNFTSSNDCINAEMDEKLLGHILTNLLSNALKYSPEGGAVQFDLVCTDSEARFRISDNGIGIPKSDFAHLFESFSRAQNVGVIQGTGLGLAIVKKAVDLHKGTIAVESAVGVGTTFSVTLPLRATV